MNNFIECVANFSEGRNQVTITALQNAICSVRNVHLLDTHQDVDHNRSVLTFVGSPESLKQAAFRAIQVASEKIDVSKHQGVHPRIGAADVIPFVPITPDQMNVCKNIARELAERVGYELDIPVYCYGEAAFNEKRRNLEDIRRGQYEWLKDDIKKDVLRQPDFGPARLGPAGATVIGARKPLIAFNVYLATNDIYIARAIARKIRESSGGLPCVKALGLYVGGQTQVSMNLTDFRVTSIADVISAIEEEATKFQTSIDHSELVGLLPIDALLTDGSKRWYLPELNSNQILENRFATLHASATQDFVNELSSPQTLIAGVAAAAQTGVIAAALIYKISKITEKFKRYQDRKNEMQLLAENCQAIIEKFTDVIHQEARVIRAFRKSSQSNPLSQNAARDMINSPLNCVMLAAELLDLAIKAAVSANTKAKVDSMIAGELALAIYNSAKQAVIENLNFSDDQRFITEVQSKLDKFQDRIVTSHEYMRSLHINGFQP